MVNKAGNAPAKKKKGGAKVAAGGKKSPGGKRGGGAKKKPKAGGKVSKTSNKKGGKGKKKKKKKKKSKKDSRDKYKKDQEKVRKKAMRKRKKKNAFQKFWAQINPVKQNNVELVGPAKQAAELLHLSPKDIRRVKNQFDDIDIDGSGEIDYDEFFEFLDEKRSPFADSLFALIDLDGSGTIDFSEFMQVLTTYCMYTKEDILKYSYDTFDKDGSGTIDEKEFQDMCMVINNAQPTFPGNFKTAMEQFDRNDDGLIDFDEFRELNKRYPIILFPAFRIQDKMQKATLGESKWIKIMEAKQHEAFLEEYKRTHDGALPPESWWVRTKRKIFPCCYKKDDDDDDEVGGRRRRRQSVGASSDAASSEYESSGVSEG